MLRRQVATLLFFTVIGTATLNAQTSGTITRRTSDSSGAVVVGSSVTAENPGASQVQRATTNTEGSYVFPSLPPGVCQLKVEGYGFKTLTQSGITLQANENVRTDAVLDVGSVHESVEVSADAVHVDTDGATVGISVDSQRLIELPLDDRNAMNLAQLMPGVSGVSAPTAMTFARTGGTTLNVSGGSSAEFLRNTNLNARNFFAKEPQELIQNQFGGSIGGLVEVPSIYRGRGTRRSSSFCIRVSDNTARPNDKYAAEASGLAGNFKARHSLWEKGI